MRAMMAERGKVSRKERKVEGRRNPAADAGLAFAEIVELVNEPVNFLFELERIG